MNERIKELKYRAEALAYEEHKANCIKNGRDPSMPHANALNMTFEKFAELIVADCLKQIQDRMVDESELLYEHEETTECVNEALMDAHHNIAIHFGFAELFGVKE